MVDYSKVKGRGMDDKCFGCGHLLKVHRENKDGDVDCNWCPHLQCYAVHPCKCHCVNITIVRSDTV